MSIKYIRVLPRIDTIDNWKKYNPILKENELCIVIMKRNICKWKIGDGKTTFKKLKYIRNLRNIQRMLCYSCIPETKDSNDNIHHIITVIDINPKQLKENQRIAPNSNYDENADYIIFYKILENAKDEATLVRDNPILMRGQIQLSKDRWLGDLPCIKIGDGVSNYNSLPFIDSKN